LVAGGREDALRVELDADVGVLAVPDGHEDAVLGPGRGFEAVGQ
jgi:hypothetical protein